MEEKINDIRQEILSIVAELEKLGICSADIQGATKCGELYHTFHLHMNIEAENR